ncbi:MAG TPA: sigma-70 family RNA polymerase sigma factor [Bryobacteraceae bacterium]|jgi:RNA polymerase sigma-70 factor (ECF subfamily)|nr:sigma-70 family RNA polymerase sigma factor [Bryobacteraceae bacterium]
MLKVGAGEETSWDLRAAVCRAGIGDLAALGDEHLMLLLQSAEDGPAIDDLFGEFFRRYRPKVVSWCTRLVRNFEEGAEMAQEVFLRAYRYRHTFRGDSRVSTWLYTITRNHCLNAIRRVETDPLRKSDPLPAALIDASGDLQADVEKSQTIERMWRLIEETLTAVEKRVMALHYGHEIALDTITRELMLSNPSGAKAYIVNARRKLKRVLGDAGRQARAA